MPWSGLLPAGDNLLVYEIFTCCGDGPFIVVSLYVLYVVATTLKSEAAKGKPRGPQFSRSTIANCLHGAALEEPEVHPLQEGHALIALGTEDT